MDQIQEILNKRYINMLKKYSEYSNDGTQLSFTYENYTSEKLLTIREKFNLNSKVENIENAELRIITLMNWVNDHVIHDGYADYVGKENAIDILEYVRNNKKGVNCRCVSIVMNDILLSMGFISRIIICMPKGEVFDDCHAVNIVYLKDKWVVIDPTMRSFFRDKDNNLLGIKEVREALVNGTEVYVNKELSWNGTTYDPDEYMVYMAKNLFRFACPLASECSFESKKIMKEYVFLNPLKYQNYLSPQTAINGDICYYTTDSEFFWSAPSFNPNEN